MSVHDDVVLYMGSSFGGTIELVAGKALGSRYTGECVESLEIYNVKISILLTNHFYIRGA